MPSKSRQELLDAAIDYVAENGIGELSLRTLATAVGTSHRMLIFHFGSKEGLWIAIVREVEERQRARLREFLSNPEQPAGEAMWRWWKHISDPSLWNNARLFFEIYGQALQGRAHTTEFLDGIVDDWLEPAAEMAIAQGVPAQLARAQARFGVDATRGLLLDLLATGDTEAVDAAMRVFIEFFEAWTSRSRAVSDSDTNSSGANTGA